MNDQNRTALKVFPLPDGFTVAQVKKIKIPERVIITLRMFKFAYILLHSNPADYQKTNAS